MHGHLGQHEGERETTLISEMLPQEAVDLCTELLAKAHPLPVLSLQAEAAVPIRANKALPAAPVNPQPVVQKAGEPGSTHPVIVDLSLLHPTPIASIGADPSLKFCIGVTTAYRENSQLIKLMEGYVQEQAYGASNRLVAWQSQSAAKNVGDRQALEQLGFKVSGPEGGGV